MFVTKITSFRGEVFYWTEILFFSILGTALGDFFADNSGLSFFGGAILISSFLTLIILTHYFLKVSTVLLFWLAFVLTRPFGATFGDLLTKPLEKGGLNFGTIGASMILFVILMVLIIISIIKNNPIEKANWVDKTQKVKRFQINYSRQSYLIQNSIFIQNWVTILDIINFKYNYNEKVTISYRSYYVVISFFWTKS